MKNKTLTRKIVLTIAVCAVLAGSIGAAAYFKGKSNNSSSASDTITNSGKSGNSADNGNAGSAGSGSANSASGAAVSDMALKISDKDNETTYNEAESKLIDLSSATGPVKITEAGTYIVTGKTDDGMIIVDVDGESDDVHLILRDAVINSSSSAAVYVLSADEVYITLEGNNILSNGGKYEAIDENDIDSVIYSKDDLTINGSGSLTIDATVGHAIVCKDDMVITGGTYDLTAEPAMMRSTPTGSCRSITAHLISPQQKDSKAPTSRSTTVPSLSMQVMTVSTPHRRSKTTWQRWS